MNANTTKLYDPALASCYELSICDTARHAYSDLWGVQTAQKLCVQLLHRDRIPELTDADYENIAAVAAGGCWPVPDAVYTMEQWAADRTLKCVAGQEIAEDVYDAMLNVLPPMSLPRTERTQEYCAGFLCSEPYCFNPVGKGQLYSAFGRKNGRYYYIGLLPARA